MRDGLGHFLVRAFRRRAGPARVGRCLQARDEAVSFVGRLERKRTAIANVPACRRHDRIGHVLLEHGVDPGLRRLLAELLDQLLPLLAQLAGGMEVGTGEQLVDDAFGELALRLVRREHLVITCLERSLQSPEDVRMIVAQRFHVRLQQRFGVLLRAAGSERRLASIGDLMRHLAAHAHLGVCISPHLDLVAGDRRAHEFVFGAALVHAGGCVDQRCPQQFVRGRTRERLRDAADGGSRRHLRGLGRGLGLADHHLRHG